MVTATTTSATTASMEPGEFRAAIDTYLDVDPDRLDNDELFDRLRDVDHLGRRIEALRLALVSACDRRRVHQERGLLNPTQDLAATLGLSPGRAQGLLRQARALEKLPKIAAAARRGDLNSMHLRVITDLSQVAEARLADWEEFLIELATTRAGTEFNQAAATLSDALDDLREQRATERWQRRHLRVGARLDGMVALEGLLDPESGETLITALSALLDRERRSGGDYNDHRNPGQRRVDALTDICRSHLDGGERPIINGERPHLSVLVDLQTLQGKAGGTASFGQTGTVITPEGARRLACDASISRIITNGESQPLDVGRATRTIPTGIRRAVVVRDRSCRWPGCGRPHQWCDVHHLVHWVEGGETKLENLILTCRPHHRYLHEAGYRITGPVANPTFLSPNGTPIRAP